MRSVQSIPEMPEKGQKFRSPFGDTTFTIKHGNTLFVVDQQGNVISPANTPLNYFHSDQMMGNQSRKGALVKDFLTVTPDLDTPLSIP